MKLVSIPNNDNSTQVKDEEIYAAMNAMCEIFGETGHADEALLQSQIDQDVIPISAVPSHESYIHHNNMDDTLSLTQVDLVLDSHSPTNECTAKEISNTKNENVSKAVAILSKSSKRKKQKSLVSREDLDKYLKEKKTKRKTQKSEQRKTKKLTDPTQCLTCGKTFAYGYMESHVRTHSGYVGLLICFSFKCISSAADNFVVSFVFRERPFKCTCCHLKFSQPGNLALHMRVHSGFAFKSKLHF